MTRPFDVSLPLEIGYRRNVLFAVQLLDAVTLSRVSQGLDVVAEGLRREPILNASGMFVWLEEDFGALRKLTVEPRRLPYERVELDASDVQRPLTTVELSPRFDYPFTPGITGLRGAVIEERVASPERPVAVANAEVRLRWLDEDGNWRDAPTTFRTDVNGGFAAVVRRARQPGPPPAVVPAALAVRVRVRRAGLGERISGDLALPQGRVADPSTFPQGQVALVFAWDELQP